MTFTTARSAACELASSVPDFPLDVGIKTPVATCPGIVSGRVAMRVVAAGSLDVRLSIAPEVSGKQAFTTERASSRSMSPASATDIRPGTTMAFCSCARAARSGAASLDGSPVDAAKAGPADAVSRRSRMFLWLSSRSKSTSVRNGIFSAASSAGRSAGRNIRSVMRTNASRQDALGAVNVIQIASRLVVALTAAPISSSSRSISPFSRPVVVRNQACSRIWASAR